MKNILKEIEDINNRLLKYAKKYYLDDKPLISDLEYDQLYLKYASLIKKNPSLEPENSILQQVGFKIGNKFQKVNHKFPMLSLSNAFNKEDLQKFNKQIQEQLHSSKKLQYVVEPKIDGLSISLLYKHGKLFQGVTRGNGIQGENVTHNVLEIKDIPKTIDYKEEIEFRGEIFMSKSTFKKLNDKGESFANPRNAAAGSLRRLDSSEVKKRDLQSLIYSIPNPLSHKLTTQEQVLKFIASQGFNTTKTWQVHNDIDSAIDYVLQLAKQKNHFDYEIDGFVLKINDVTLYEEIGQTVKFPKFMISYKFPEEIVTTKLVDIFPTVGRTGRITYNAKLLPVKLSNTIVSAATLHNADYIKKINVNIGDIVKVKKAGEIIPKIVNFHQKINNNLWNENQACPSCQQKLKKFPEEVDQYCINSDCKERVLASFTHFVSRNAFNIEGLSSEIIRTFLENKFLSDFSSIFELYKRQDEIVNLKRFHNKSTSNIINSINRSKQITLDKFIFALGIRYVGSKTSKIIAKRLGTIKNIMCMSKEKMLLIRDVGAKVAVSISDYFAIEQNIKQIHKMINSGVDIKELSKPQSSKLENNTFVITGTLSKPRNYFKKIIESHNGNIANYISSKTNYLLAGNGKGSKLSHAKEKNIIILNEQDFIKLLEE